MMEKELPRHIRILMALANKVRARHEPGIIAITGKSGRRTAALAIYAALSGLRAIRITSAHAPENTAVPLAIIGAPEEGNGFMFWLHAFRNGLQAAYGGGSYPEVLGLECPSGQRDCIETLLALARPQITVVTALPDAESMKVAPLIEALPSNGYGILDFDSPGAAMLARHTRAHVIGFGFSDRADMRIADFEPRERGISFALEYGGERTPLMIEAPGAGRIEASAAAAAACVGTAFGMRLPRIAHALAYWHELNKPKADGVSDFSP